MKKLITILAAVLVIASVLAQAPEKMSYQAVIRDTNGALLKNTAIGLRISILQGSASGIEVSVETQTPSTNENGLISIEINVSSFSESDWAGGPYFLKIETDPSGGNNYTITGISQLLAVPYSLYTNLARHADTAQYAVNAGSAGNGGFSNLQVFSSSGNFTVPQGITKVMVELWGAGGGGGGGGGSGGSTKCGGTGGGGGGGSYGKDIITVTPNATIAVTIGSGGSGGAGGSDVFSNLPGVAGGNGQNSGFGTLLANGGNSGNGGNNGNTSNGAGGSGGSGGSSNCSINIAGGFGEEGVTVANNPAYQIIPSGYGGAAGGGAAGGNPGGDLTPGGGGSGGMGGCSAGSNGSSGGNGRVIVWW